jgi:glycosyltransferase involved in cell wall biosynthesis
VVPSIGYEVFPTVVLEAYAHGTPVIGHRLGPIPEMLDGRGGLTYATDRELAGALNALQDNPGLRSELGHLAAATYEALWTPERHFERYFDLIAGLEADRARAGRSVAAVSAS